MRNAMEQIRRAIALSANLLSLVWVMVLSTMAVPLAAQNGSNLLPNNGFEQGTSGWILVLGGYGDELAGWEKAGEHARIADQPVHTGLRALVLNAVALDHEVDVYSQAVAVEPDHGYRLGSFVRQSAGSSGYKVTIDWQTADGKHLRYDNDWRGSDKPKEFQPHGGIFAAPAEARRATLILGVQAGVQCAFDDLSLQDLGVTEPLGARPRRNGDGKAEITGPKRVEALGYGTWRVVYTCGESGLLVGGALVLRRWPISFDWSPPQTTRPKDAGFVTVKGPRNAQFQVTAGQVQEIVVKLEWPALLPGESVEITLGDRDQGGPGMGVQGKLAERGRWIAASNCTAEGEYQDLRETTGGQFEVVPGAPRTVCLVTTTVAEVGKATTIRTEVRDAAGNPTDQFEGQLQLSCVPHESGFPKIVSFREGELSVKTLNVTWARPGPKRVDALPKGMRIPGTELKSAEFFVSQPCRLDLLKGQGVRSAVREGGASIANNNVALLFPRNPLPDQFGCATLMVCKDGDWVKVAELAAVGRVVPQQKGGAHTTIPIFAQSAKATVAGGEAILTLSGMIRPGGTRTWPFTAVYRLGQNSRHIGMRLTVAPRSRASIASLSAPALYAGDASVEARRSGASLPGLEFLSEQEKSSDDYGVAATIRNRWIPHPYKITVPLMAVAGDKAVVGIMWDPLQKWDGKRAVPLAQFASPNRREDRRNHLMSLCLPGLTADFKENVAGVAKGWAPPVGSQLSLSADIFALANTEDVTEAVRYYAQTHPLPRTNPPRSLSEGLALSARGLTQTAWDAKTKGWITAVGWKPGFQSDIADRLLQVADVSGLAGERMRAQAREAIKNAGGPKGIALSLRVGDAGQAISTLREMAYGWMEKQHSEGYWTFAEVYSTEGQKATLAQPDDVELGTCVNPLDPILTYAAATGDPQAVEAGLRGLDYIKRFYKPAGSESWEVPLVCPNLRAAALATRCFLRGWQLTGLEEYLRLARRWAWAGASFIYQWEAPDLPAMPGASISVMGTTFYTHPWFGAAVQWVGLFYAEVLQEFAQYDNSYNWRSMAELITVSALHQQKTDTTSCKHIGFFPDSFNLVQGKDYYEWCLAPTGLVSNLIGLMGYSSDLRVTTLQAGKRSLHILSVARPTQCRWDSVAQTLRIALKSPPGSDSQVVIHGLQEPGGVVWGGKRLERLGEKSDASEGWFSPSTEQCLVFRLHWTKQEAELIVEDAQPVDYRSPPLPARIVNGGFEQDELGWSCNPAAKIDVDNPHSGQSGLLIDAPDPQQEVQATSSPFAVVGGKLYRLRAWVKQIEGEGGYKVTIDWLNAAGQHIAYENDWQGNNRPREYQEHGGVFQSPGNAAQARIILGCRGARCVFDDISLERNQ